MKEFDAEMTLYSALEYIKELARREGAYIEVTRGPRHHQTGTYLGSHRHTHNILFSAWRQASHNRTVKEFLAKAKYKNMVNL